MHTYVYIYTLLATLHLQALALQASATMSRYLISALLRLKPLNPKHR